MTAAREWLAGRTIRERRLLALGAVFVVAFLGWLLVVRPLLDAEATTRARFADASERLGAVRERMAAFGATGGARVAAARGVGAVDLFVARSAAEAGFTLDRNDPAGVDRTAVAIGTARPTAVLGWLGGLEASGVTADELSVRPSAVAGSVAVTASLRRVGS